MARIVAFCGVGFLAFLGYLSAVAAVVESGGSPVVGAVLGFAVGTAISFTGNSLWVFKVAPTAMVGMRFLVTTLLGLVLNIGLAWLLTRWGVHYVPMTVIIFVIVPAFNYLGHRFWTFAQSGSPTAEANDG